MALWDSNYIPYTKEIESTAGVGVYFVVFENSHFFEMIKEKI